MGHLCTSSHLFSKSVFLKYGHHELCRALSWGFPRASDSNTDVFQEEASPQLCIYCFPSHVGDSWLSANKGFEKAVKGGKKKCFQVFPQAWFDYHPSSSWVHPSDRECAHTLQSGLAIVILGVAWEDSGLNHQNGSHFDHAPNLNLIKLRRTR